MSEGGLRAEGFPEAAVRERARAGAAKAFPDPEDYGRVLFGADPAGSGGDLIDRLRLVPPIFVPHRLERLVDLAREPMYRDVDLATTVGGFRSTLPVYLSAFGSTRAASGDLGLAVSRQAARLGIPMVVGENVMPVKGYGRIEDHAEQSMLRRISTYAEYALDGFGGVAIQQSTEDADAEVWNLVYSDPNVASLLESGRLAFELKVGQGAKPGLGGMTVLDAGTAARLTDAFIMDPVFGGTGDAVLRCSSPGTFTDEILRQQIRLMRNNFPQARVWVKLPPARDVRAAALVAWEAGADAVTVDGAEGGTGWAPVAFLQHVGLPLGECLRRLAGTREPDPDRPPGGVRDRCLLVSGRIWEGTRVAKCLALGADAVGLGRAALLAVDTDPDNGLVNLVGCLSLELQMLTSALGKYQVGLLAAEDVWSPDELVDPAPRNSSTESVRS